MDTMKGGLLRSEQCCIDFDDLFWVKNYIIRVTDGYILKFDNVNKYIVCCPFCGKKLSVK